MISYWVPKASAFGILDWAEDQARQVLMHVDLRPYEHLAPAMRVPLGTHVFAGVTELLPAQREAVAQIWDQLEGQPGARLLNDPRKVQGRYGLLTRLAEDGQNSYRVHRASEAGPGIRFPVFVRHAVEHTGNMTELIEDWPTLRALLRHYRSRAVALEDLLVVEWLDATDHLGFYRKYAAFRIGDRICGAHIMCSPTWMVKSGGRVLSREVVLDDLAYMRDNPHTEWIMRAFGTAGLEFGRIDYGVVRGLPQVWEINDNPTIGAARGRPPEVVSPEAAADRQLARRLRHETIAQALIALDDGDRGETTVHVDESLLHRIGRERAQFAWRRRRREFIRSLFQHPASAPMRRLWRRLYRHPQHGEGAPPAAGPA